MTIQFQIGNAGVGNTGIGGVTYPSTPTSASGALAEVVGNFDDPLIAYDGNEEADIVDTIDAFVDNLIGTIPPSFGTFAEQIADFFDAVSGTPGAGAVIPPPILQSSALGGSGGGKGLDWNGKPDSGKPRIKIVEKIVRHEIRVPTVDPATKQRIAALEHEVQMLRGRLTLEQQGRAHDHEEMEALMHAVLNET